MSSTHRERPARRRGGGRPPDLGEADLWVGLTETWYHALFLRAEAIDGLEIEWAWAIHRLPSRTLVLRSIPAYADCPQALAAGGAVVADIGRRLGVLVVGGAG